MTVWALLLGVWAARADFLPQDRQRTGMAGVGVRSWSVDRDAGKTEFVGVEVSRLVTDNVSVGLLAGRHFGPQAESWSLDGTIRNHFFPLQRVSPWMEVRLGGLLPNSQAPGAARLGLGLGVRTRPWPWLCLDFDVFGAERWGYDDPAQGTDGKVEWVFHRPSLLGGLSDFPLIQALPQPSLQILF